MKLVILDRDGVINEDSDEYIRRVDEFVFLPGSIEAIARLCQAGFTVAVATNQSGLGRGYFDLDDLEAMHAKLATAVEEAGGELAGIFYCPHVPEDECACRKPKAGLLDAIEAELGTPVRGAWVVGDSLRDLQSGLLKGCRPLLVRTGKGERTLARLQQSPEPGLEALPVFDDLAAAAGFIIGQDGAPA